MLAPLVLGPFPMAVERAEVRTWEGLAAVPGIESTHGRAR